ncbi:MAG: hypothetical protein JKY13_02055 [Gammaproteobacteria bacterium]|nr:hypothetical protein [Gammaproteobacteria bacterium]
MSNCGMIIQNKQIIHHMTQNNMLNQAVIYFDQHKQLRFDAPYRSKTLLYLAGLFADQHDQLKQVYLANSAVGLDLCEQFFNQLHYLRSVQREIRRPLAFIFQEPTLHPTNHYLFALLQQDNLIIIDPQGLTKKTINNDVFNKALANAQRKGLIKTIFFSNTKLQHDKQQSPSCGPICIELLKSFLQASSHDIAQGLSRYSTSSLQSGLRYNIVNIATLLTDSLKNISPLNYQVRMMAIRKSHRCALTFFEKNLTVQQQNQQFKKWLNPPYQLLI